jgi:hypothetical protein
MGSIKKDHAHRLKFWLMIPSMSMALRRGAHLGALHGCIVVANCRTGLGWFEKK